MHQLSSPFLTSLHSDGPAPDRAAGMDLYGWLIGSWRLDYTEHLPDRGLRQRAGEWHFGWVLEGRAIQDVWIVPPRGERQAGGGDHRCDYYGTTLRIYDPGTDAWQIYYADPVAQVYVAMVGRKEGQEIVQLGTNAAGQPVRWRFTDITSESFLWLGEYSTDEGTTWLPRTQFRAWRQADHQH